MLMHGRIDPVVPVLWGEMARDELVQRGYKVRWHDYEMGHTLCPEELSTIGRWIEEII